MRLPTSGGASGRVSLARADPPPRGRPLAGRQSACSLWVAPAQPVQVALKAGDLALEVQCPILADASSLPDPEVAHFPHERELSLDLAGLRCEISRGKGLPLR